ncbi:hypothetical protein FLA105535_03589 [Flavobacterium bizetiae]|nr:hypothetical protein FLA105535_03589 [Flavobacterium bizetiae]CAD5349584.1 hypothetical protein FLA105534_03570 [Flavobacterium bizetiae]
MSFEILLFLFINDLSLMPNKNLAVYKTSVFTEEILTKALIKNTCSNFLYQSR